MRKAVRIAAVAAAAMVAGALAAPSAALAGPVTFKYPLNTATRVQEINGYDVAERGQHVIGYADLALRPSGAYLLTVCDRHADSRSVFGRVDTGNNGIVEYSAPASNTTGNSGLIGCNTYVLGSQIRKYRLRIAAAASDWRSRP